MEQKVFNLGDGLCLKLWDCGEAYYGRVNIKVWRKLMPSYTLRSGLESENGDLWKSDFRNDSVVLNQFLDKLAQRLNRHVFLFQRSHIGSWAYILEQRGVNFDSGALLITIFKDM